MHARHSLLLLVLFPFVAFAQLDTASIHIVHGTACDARISLGIVEGLPRHRATVTSRDGEQQVYEGPLLTTVLAHACPSVAALDKRATTAAAIKATAVDGFTAVAGFMELDSTFKARPVLLGIIRDGHPLDGHYGPFQLIVPEDLQHSRNVRNLVRVEVLQP